MRVTVIPEDLWIRRDNEAARLPDWPFSDANVHAIQWYGQAGEIEYKGYPKPPNEIIDNFSILDPYLAELDKFLAAQGENP